MKVKRNYKPLVTALCALLALIMLVLCHCAASPTQLLPRGFRYSAYAVSQLSYEADIRPGDLVIFDKNAATLNTGAVVRYIPHAFSSARYATQTGAALGRLVIYEPTRGDMLEVYTVQVNYGGQIHTAMSGKPELAIYRIAGLGSAVMALHSARFLVWGLCGATTLAATIGLAATARRRRIRRNRESYLLMFDRFAQQLEQDEADF